MVNVKVDAFKSVIVTGIDGKDLRIDEGMRVKFSNDAGEVVGGILSKISGKGEKTKLQIIPYDTQKQEIWELLVMADNSLSIDTED